MYAKDEKIAKALLWRREFGVNGLCQELAYLGGEWVRTGAATTVAQPSVLELCSSGSLTWENATPPMLRAVVPRADWNDTLATLQHHVRVIEHGIAAILPLTGAQCFSVCVDVSKLDVFCMPSTAVIRGLISLFQTAYPERIDRIYVAPVNSMLRRVLELFRPLMSARSRHKVVFLASFDST